MDFKYYIYLFFIIMSIGMIAAYTLHPNEQMCVNVTSKEFTPSHETTTEIIIWNVIWPITSTKPDQYVLCLNDSRRLVVDEKVYTNATIGINCIGATP